MNKPIKPSGVFLFLCMNISICYAEHKLPIFSGYWYTDAKFIKDTACTKYEYIYSNYMAGSAETVTNQIFCLL